MKKIIIIAAAVLCLYTFEVNGQRLAIQGRGSPLPRSNVYPLGIPVTTIHLNITETPTNFDCSITNRQKRYTTTNEDNFSYIIDGDRVCEGLGRNSRTRVMNIAYAVTVRRQVTPDMEAIKDKLIKRLQQRDPDLGVQVVAGNAAIIT